jgi:AP-3 complex subunit beta
MSKVVLAVTRVFYYVGPASQVFTSVNPLLRLFHLSKEVESIVIVYILVMSRDFPVRYSVIEMEIYNIKSQSLFSPFYSRFLVCTDDIQQVKRDKVRLLLNILTIDNYQAILREFIVGRISKSYTAPYLPLHRTTQMM